MSLCGILVLAGCQNTPDKNAVVSKVDRLSKDVLEKPLESGETNIVDLPKAWKASNKYSNDRVTINADLPLESVTIGNTPVLETKNRVITQEELEVLTKHFAGDKPLYVPEKNTKDVYQYLKERIDNREGHFADLVLASSNKTRSDNLGKAMEHAPAETGALQKTEVKFQEKPDDKAYYMAKGMDVPEKNNMKLFFSADIGDDRQAYMEAAQYSADAGNTSKFIWRTGAYIFSAKELHICQTYNASSVAFKSEHGMAWQKILDNMQSILGQDSISSDAGEAQANKLLTELGLQDMALLSQQKTLWFPNGSIQGVGIISSFDYTWQVEPEKIKTGYEYTFSPTVNGLSINQLDLSATNNKAQSGYAPPFPVETVTIVVTQDGIQSFIWDGMCDTASTIAENTKLLPFKDIQTKLFDQIYYHYVSMNQPANSKTNFAFPVTKASLGYTYIPAYKNPGHAWLVPAWFFTVKVQVDDTIESGVSYEDHTLEFMFNALDGGFIARVV